MEFAWNAAVWFAISLEGFCGVIAMMAAKLTWDVTIALGFSGCVMASGSGGRVTLARLRTRSFRTA